MEHEVLSSEPSGSGPEVAERTFVQKPACCDHPAVSGKLCSAGSSSSTSMQATTAVMPSREYCSETLSLSPKP